MRRHIVLVGLPGSGKTTVGRRVAQLLDTALTDIDETVAMAAGKSVSAIFAAEGEALFRTMERATMDGAVAAPPHVIAPGAGWMVQPGNLEAAAGTYLIYLRVPVEVAAARLTCDASRPLLSGDDPAGRIRTLLVEREGWYRRSTSQVDASGSAESVAGAVTRVARQEAGW